MAQNRVRVYARVRPALGGDTSSGPSPIRCDESAAVLSVKAEGNKSSNVRAFQFDGVFNGSCKQQSVYETIAAPVLSEVMRG